MECTVICLSILPHQGVHSQPLPRAPRVLYFSRAPASLLRSSSVQKGNVDVLTLLFMETANLKVSKATGSKPYLGLNRGYQYSHSYLRPKCLDLDVSREMKLFSHQ